MNQVDSNNTTINLDEYDTISPMEQEVNEEYLFWKTDKEYNTDFSHDNNHIQDHETNYDDNYDGHPKNKMPNNGGGG